MNSTGIVIVAAGSSSRLGKPKQLLQYRSQSLITHVTGEAIKAKLQPVVVVTGAKAELVLKGFNKEGVTIVYNQHWQQGMASSIVAGLLKVLFLNSQLQNLLLSVCDQPFVSALLFQQLLKIKEETGKGIVACTYAETLGTPVLFNRIYFDRLQGLTGDEGAKKLVKMYMNDVATVAFPQGNIDIDTEEDYKNLLNQKEWTIK